MNELQELISLVMPYLIPIAAIIFLLLMPTDHGPLIVLIAEDIWDKIDHFYYKHWGYKRIPFGEKWNKMLERLDYMAWLEKKGIKFTWEDV